MANMFFLKEGILLYIDPKCGASTTKCSLILMTGATIGGNGSLKSILVD